jgi:enoyl-CoA hydratase/carnithine racemase
VSIERNGDSLAIVLNRPRRHNAFTPAMRDGLTEALQLALNDPAIDYVTLQGAGPSFCSGGDLATFGSFDDPASAHIVRLTRSPARLMAQLAKHLAERFEVRLHGACMGAGIELAAFASRVVARRNARISLPEVALGLVPGAGGTVSIPTRIGRHRTMLLALGGSIDAATALDWGLIDEVTDDLTSLAV